MVEKSFKRHIVKVLAVIILFSCSPQKRLNRLVKKHPSLVQLDTIKIIDTVITPTIQHDTTTVFQYHDSVTVVNNSKTFLKYFYDTLTREIHHEYICFGDTIIQEKIIPIEKIVYKEINWWEKYQSLIYIFLIAFVLLVIYKRLTK
tara:strand:- start:478 stop:915 length:438 start_codon:yes stop_codon:yes gene_type:complete